MKLSNTLSSPTRFFAPIAFAAVLLAPGTASASSPHCRPVHGPLEILADAPTCGSAISLCAHATLSGGLRAVSDFIGTSSVATVDTPATGVVVLTGDNVLHTRRGDIFTKDTIVLATTGAGEFAEVDVIVGGTGDWTGATGAITATGTFVEGVGEGSYSGVVCRP